MTKISDVAAKTGYSITTISRAINDHPYVSDKAKKKIFDVMRELDYYPNNVAQQLRGKGTKLIGVIISFVTNPFFTYKIFVWSLCKMCFIKAQGQTRLK